MSTVIGVVIVLVGLALVFNVGGLAVWGSKSENNARDASGHVKQVQPVWISRVIGVVAIIAGIVAIVG
ncbi:hypothetical protein [Patulibacter americanus]|uniref:hypothetical protein n=1 Tax=Patulibacter americanus TaxID=588672 RepID=UPI0003B707D8|nr:hypothetical protein [Patulibacter americanus]